MTSWRFPTGCPFRIWSSTVGLCAAKTGPSWWNDSSCGRTNEPMAPYSGTSPMGSGWWNWMPYPKVSIGGGIGGRIVLYGDFECYLKDAYHIAACSEPTKAAASSSQLRIFQWNMLSQSKFGLWYGKARELSDGDYNFQRLVCTTMVLSDVQWKRWRGSADGIKSYKR